MKYGLLGQTLGHSFSPQIHHALGNDKYTLYEKQPEELANFLADPELQGINITIPYKEAVMPYCSSISEVAQRIGCVNTMYRQANGEWQGHNTDYDGAIYVIKYANISIQDKHCLILGDGATSKTLHTVLEDLGAASITHISRHQAPTYDDVAKFYESANIIVNTTPVGMYPNCPKALVSLEHFTKLSGVIDVIYNPHRSQLILEAEALDIPCMDGLPMLVAQAVAAAQYFQGKHIEMNQAEQILSSLRQDLENIVLIGMPGVGKTTIGKALAEKLGREFVDADAALVERLGTLADFISTQGEPAFRIEETRNLLELGKRTGLVIATGGGCVTVSENFAPLRQNGRLYQLRRPITELATEGRVLSQGGLDHLAQLEKKRTPLYEKFAHVIVDNQDIESTVDKIIKDFQEVY